MSEQRRLFKVGKKEATRAWREAEAVVDQLDATEAGQVEVLKATRKALGVARANAKEARAVLMELLDQEDPTIPGVIDASRTLPGEA